MQRGDIIHMVDIDLSDQQEASTAEGWLFENAAGVSTAYEQHRNFIRFKFDYRLRQISITFKALALNAGNCGALAIRSFLHRNQIVWDRLPPTHPHLRISRGVFYNGALWVIDSVNASEGTFAIHCRRNVAEAAVLQIKDTNAYRLL